MTRTVKFIEKGNGKLITDGIPGKIGVIEYPHPGFTGQKPNAGETWEVEVVGGAGRVAVLRPIRRFDKDGNQIVEK